MTASRGIRTRGMNINIPHGEYGPWIALATAIVEQAILDIKRLQKEGVMYGKGVLVDKWPVGWNLKNKDVGGYKSHSDAESLVDFFKNGWCEQAIDSLGSNLTTDKIRKELDI